MAKLTSIASRYPVRPKLEQNRAYTPTFITLDSKGYQIVTRKKKALEELAEAFLNIGAVKSKLGKQGRLLLATRLTEKKLRQQTIQFSSPVTKFTGAFGITLEQAFELVLETIEDSTDTNMKAAPSSFL